VDSAPNEGTTFTIELPVMDETASMVDTMDPFGGNEGSSMPVS
jgi:hypothetical protein